MPTPPPSRFPEKAATQCADEVWFCLSETNDVLFLFLEYGAPAQRSRVTTRRSAPPTAWSSSRRPHARHASRLGPPDARRPREPSPPPRRRRSPRQPRRVAPRRLLPLAAFFFAKASPALAVSRARRTGPRHARLQDTVCKIPFLDWTADPGLRFFPSRAFFLLSPPARATSLPRSNLPTGPEPTGPSSARFPPAPPRPAATPSAPVTPRGDPAILASTFRMNRARHASDGAATAPRFAAEAFRGSRAFFKTPNRASASRNDAQSASREGSRNETARACALAFERARSPAGAC